MDAITRARSNGGTRAYGKTTLTRRIHIAPFRIYSDRLFSAIHIGEGGATGAGSARHHGPMQVAMPDDGGF